MNQPAQVVSFQQPDRQPPVATEAEISVLGACLIDPDAIAKAVEVLDADMFYREAHRRIYRVMVGLFERGENAADPTGLMEALKATDELERVGGIPYLSELMDAVATAANVEYHARLIQERALMRRAISASSDTIQDMYQPGEASAEELLDRAERRIMDVATGRRSGEMNSMRDLLYPAFERIEELQNAEGGVTGVDTGFHDLNDMTGGFQKGDLILLAARPSMGKTALVTDFVIQCAVRNGQPAGIFSVEMSKQQLIQRMLCNEALVDLGRMLRGRLNDDDYVRLAQAAGPLNAAPIWVDDESTTVLAMRAKARRLKVQQPDLALVVVDYIQLMNGEGDNDNQKVGNISKGLKHMARELDVPVIALSQLSRAPEQRTDHRPQLSDLRDSGTLEQDADLVMFLYRPDYYIKDVQAEEQGVAGKAELIIGKQRNGPTGTVELFFRKESTRFESFTPRMG